MPGEISRSNPGPGDRTPLVPSWICKESDEHKQSITKWKKCPTCWTGFTDTEIDEAFAKAKKE